MVIVAGREYEWGLWVSGEGPVPALFARLVPRGDELTSGAGGVFVAQKLPDGSFFPGGFSQPVIVTRADNWTKPTTVSRRRTNPVVDVAPQRAQMAASRPRIGLAFSGGGFRATVFGLGALRALHDRGVLRDVTVVSGISGGSLLTAMWAYGPESFTDFDNDVAELVTTGLQGEIARRAFAPRAVLANAASLTRVIAGKPFGGQRSSTRTEALVQALTARPFGRRQLRDVTHPGLATVISATDLATGNAVRFGSEVSSLASIGDIADLVPVADAVAASAAFPALLPQLNRTYTFSKRDGTQERRALLMTDGGVYDNLGLTPLLPGRSAAHTSHVYDLDYIIAVDAGQGRPVRTAPNFMLGRLKRSFEIAYSKAQDGSRARLNQSAEAGTIQGFIHPYLATRDKRLPLPLADLVPREAVVDYPTNFAPMTSEDLHRIATRGEQLTRILIEYYCPQLGSP